MTDWHIEGEWVKSCNCDAGCPCDFNARPTHGFCEGMAATKITSGHFGDVDLAGVIWGAAVRWPGALHGGKAETALAKKLIVRGAIPYEVANGHSSMAHVRHGNEVDAGAHNPTVVSAS